MNSNDVSRLYYLVNSLVAAPHDFASLTEDVLAQPREDKFQHVVGELKKSFQEHAGSLRSKSTETLHRIVDDLEKKGREGREEARFAAVALREALSMMENQARQPLKRAAAL